MGQTFRISLPGFNALTDTNLDHFSLYADIDNVLIKRVLTGSTTIAEPTGTDTILTIPHNLGYIPFFVAFCDNFNNGQWEIINNQYNLFTVPHQIAAVDTSNLYIYNFGGHGFALPVAYDIYYDDMPGGNSPSITESTQAVKVTRPGYDGLSDRNPNHYIMHSDLNNFKILKEGNATVTTNSSGVAVIAHGANVATPVKSFVFVKCPDGKTVLTGSAIQYDFATTATLTSFTDTTNITINYKPSTTISVKYYIYGAGKAGTAPISGYELAVVKKGLNAITESNPDNFNFHSAYNTLKYFQSGQDLMSTSTNLVHTIPHGLGYVPFFICFVNDLQHFISAGSYALAPYYLGRSSISTPNNDIGAFAYADATNIYLRAYFQSAAIGTGINLTWYYKIFKNNLGL